MLGEIKVQSEDIITVPEAAKRLGRPKMTLYRWLEAKKIVAFKLGGILFIPVSEVERLKGTQPKTVENPRPVEYPVKEVREKVAIKK